MEEKVEVERAGEEKNQVWGPVDSLTGRLRSLGKQRNELLGRIEPAPVVERKVRYLNGQIDQAVFEGDKPREKDLRQQISEVQNKSQPLREEIEKIEAEVERVKNERDVLALSILRSVHTASKESFASDLLSAVDVYESRLEALRIIAQKYQVEQKLNPSFFRADSKIFREKPFNKLRDRIDEWLPLP